MQLHGVHYNSLRPSPQLIGRRRGVKKKLQRRQLLQPLANNLERNLSRETTSSLSRSNRTNLRLGLIQAQKTSRSMKLERSI